MGKYTGFKLIMGKTDVNVGITITGTVEDEQAVHDLVNEIQDLGYEGIDSYVWEEDHEN